MKRPLDRPRILCFDIESTSLKADIGYVLAFGYKYLDQKKTHVLSIDQFRRKKITDDSALLWEAHKILTDEADIIVSYYGKGFDRKFLNTRMLMAGLPPLPPLSSEHIDLYWTAKGNLALHSNRLDSLARALRCPIQKTVLDLPIWTDAMAGDRKALKYIVDHCARDVEVLEYCYLKLRPFVRQHPAVGEYGDCHACGSDKAQRRGYTISKSGGRHARIFCTNCGQWRLGKI